MRPSLALAVLLLSTAWSHAEDLKQQPAVETDTTAAPELTALSQTLTRRQKDKEQGRVPPEEYKAFIDKFRADLDQTYARIPKSPANDALHARLLSRLGNSGRALAGLSAALERDPKNPALLSAKANALFENKDYPGAAAAANAVLRGRPDDKEALWLKHASEDRAAPSVHLPGSPWADRPNLTGPSARPSPTPSAADRRPALLAVKAGTTAAPPTPDPAAPAQGAAPKPDRKALAAGALGTLMLAGSGLLMLGDKAKMFVEDHPYIALGAVAAAAVVAVALVVGTGGGAAAAGGGGLMLAAANGAPIATAGTAAAGVTTTQVVVGGAVAATAAGGVVYMTSHSGEKTNKSSGSSSGDQSSKRKITFGTDHAEPHFEGTGLDQSKIEEAIRQDLEKQLERGQANVKGSFNGRINFAGRTIEYRGFGLPNGDINIGTYYQP